MEEIFLSRLASLQRGRSISQFARDLNVPQPTLYKYLQGREPPIGFVYSVCIKEGVSADWLLGLTDNPSIDRGGVTNTATAKGAGAQAAAGGTIQNADPATAAILERLAALEAKMAASSTPLRKRR